MAVSMGQGALAAARRVKISGIATLELFLVSEYSGQLKSEKYKPKGRRLLDF